MPAIIVKEYTWRQTCDNVLIVAPIFGSPKTVDLFASKNYVKASYPPYIFELFLWGEIRDDESECVFDKSNGELRFSLRKVVSGLTWPRIVDDDLDREAMNRRRSNALEEARESFEKSLHLKNDKRERLQKQAVRAQINLDTAMLNNIDMQRDNERRDAMKDFENWRSNVRHTILSGVEGELQENRKAYRPALKWFKNEKGDVESREMTREQIINKGITMADEDSAVISDVKNLESRETESSIFCNDSTIDEKTNPEAAASIPALGIDDGTKINPVGDSDNSSEESLNASEIYKGVENVDWKDSTTESFVRSINAKRSRNITTSRRNFVGNSRAFGCSKIDGNLIFDVSRKAVPLPRRNCIIGVTFTERKFPTPARESNQLEEQEWLEKQAEARRQTGFVVEDLRPEELDPQWLKDKGDEFFKAGNYLGSVSAYSHGIKLSPKMSSLYSNRSAAHYALGNYLRCTEDCSKALELMVPYCNGNLKSRAKCHARRGAALCKLSSPQHGIPELEAALKLDPDNQTVKNDLTIARRHFEMP